MVSRFKVAVGSITVLVVLVATIVMATEYIKSDKIIEGVPHQFQFTLKSQVDAGGGLIVETRQFVVSQTEMFPVLIRGPRGERAITEDSSLEPNTFVWERKLSPSVVVGGKVFQDSYTYIVVRYHQKSTENQTLIPLLQPEIKKSGSEDLEEQ